MTHPSFLALDRHAVGAGTAEVAQHVEACEACRAHVASVQVPLPRPAWLDTVAGPAPRRWRFPVFALATVLAAGLAVGVWPRPTSLDEVRPKGTPAATLWLKRGDAVSPWKGAPVRAGDSVRLEIATAGYPHVAVVRVTPTPTILFAVKADESRPAVLSPAWTLDAEHTDEHLAVVLSREALEEGAVADALTRRDVDVFTLDYPLVREHP